ncbi:MAG: deoxyribodipyrimidine photo-lyase [Bacteroidia bacterium]|nr:MAG: deoxyribodipyrimidine photo-lyase [Bacteroidia bacterium]
MFKHLVYIEEKIARDSSTKKILEKLQPSEIVYIQHYKEVLNQTNSHWLFNKEHQKIILAKRESEFYYKGSYLTPTFGFKHFYYNALAINCLFHCEYCYLQGMYNTPHLVLFLNNQDFINAIQQFIHLNNEKIYLALSYDTDLLALEQYYPYCKEWIQFANNEPRLTIEIRTKSHQIDLLNTIQPNDNVILSFTLSPEEIQKKYEPFTPKLEQRIIAVKKAIDKGFRVMICIDPMIYSSSYQSIYSKFLDYLFEQVSPKHIHAVSIGVFRMNKDFFKRIKKNGNNSDIYYYNYEIENKMVSYSPDIRREMIMFVQNILTQKGIKNIHIYD